MNFESMTINERIYYLRKKVLKISQRELGKILGVGDTAVSKLEKTGSTVTERNIKAICNEFNISYNWLVDGVGDIFIEDDKSTIELLKRDYNLRDVEVRLIEEFLKLDENERDVLINYLERAVGKVNKHATNRR